MRIRRYNGRPTSVKITNRELKMIEDLWNLRFNTSQTRINNDNISVKI